MYILGFDIGGTKCAVVLGNEKGEILKKEKFPTKTMWLYTGYLWEEIKDLELVSYLDVLVDGPFIEAKKDLMLRFRGSSNQRLIDVPKSLATDSVVLWETDPGMKPTRR